MPSSPHWSESGIEPDLESVMADPLVHLVMHRDHIGAQDVWKAVAVARLRLRVAAKRRGAMETAA